MARPGLLGLLALPNLVTATVAAALLWTCTTGALWHWPVVAASLMLVVGIVRRGDRPQGPGRK